MRDHGRALTRQVGWRVTVERYAHVREGARSVAVWLNDGRDGFRGRIGQIFPDSPNGTASIPR